MARSIKKAHDAQTPRRSGRRSADRPAQQAPSTPAFGIDELLAGTSASQTPTASIPIPSAPVTVSAEAAAFAQAASVDGPSARGRRAAAAPSRRAARSSRSARDERAPRAERAPRSAREQKAARAQKASRIRRSGGTAKVKGITPRRFVRQLVSIGAMAGVAALLVSTSLPASAFYTPEGDGSLAVANIASSAAETQDIQSMVVNAAAADAAASSAPVARDNYEAKTFQQQIIQSRVNPNFYYTNNPNGSIQWPFPGTVPITSGFGPRAVCSYCSTYHLGIDFTPGAGTPIQAITAGTVSDIVLGGGLGNHVVIDHVVNGQLVQSVYAHMAWGSIQVAVGQQVEVGTIVGAVGSTGASTGAHLHLEVHVEGTPVDPFAWLKANAN
ncbi:peptidase M23-like protein [Homoserinimonas aerilata]|uniref:Peptidase M23-like protein n=1 Tax=Homoserinimonas aerilata TaxID=1162970 RepID=A0A542YAM9_9MICO|nr:M23 family metallopeptidase [Homoserinimonas aerilata]TQL45014.1 peptidase M23-like protein [Homoserinimonas aerilata]